MLRALVTTEAPSIPLATLHRLLGVIKEREDREKGSARIEWMAARAAVHRILAARGSRVALYELRETLAAARRPLPIGFLVAVSAVGDASCLDALAAAYAHASPSRGDWWREHLKDAFQLITRRSRLTRRHRVIKRIADRWPDIAEELIPHRQPTATPRRKPRRAVASLRR